MWRPTMKPFRSEHQYDPYGEGDSLEAEYVSPPGQLLQLSTLRALYDMIGRDRHGFLDLVRIYQEEASELLERLHLSLARSDYESMLFAVHSLKSGSATMGAVRLATLCQALEEDLQEHPTDVDVSAAVHLIAEEYGLLVQTLEIEAKRLL